MIPIKREGILLEATQNSFENQAVLNPACYQKNENVHLFYRAVTPPNFSSIGYCKLNGPLNIVYRKPEPIIFPEFEWEKGGIEDPRIVKIKKTFYLFYTAYDGKNARVAYATSANLQDWKKQGLISPSIFYDDVGVLFLSSKKRLKDQYYLFAHYHPPLIPTSFNQYKINSGKMFLWEKDAFLLPKKIHGQYALIHRVLPEIQIIYFDDFNQLKNNAFWKKYLKNLGNFVVLEKTMQYESKCIGGGAPLFETKEGYLMIYHGVEDTNTSRIYHASVALLDKKNPQKILGRLKQPLFSPEKKYEKEGDVSNVVFPTGTALFKDRLFIYYGAADKRIAVVSLTLPTLIKELLNSNNCS